MPTVVVDKELREKLKDLDHEVVFCDEGGKTVGRYLPEAEYMKMLYERARHMFSDVELNAVSQEPGGFTTAEVLGHLNQL
jgi:hypothetical protein